MDGVKGSNSVKGFISMIPNVIIVSGVVEGKGKIK